MRKNKSDDVLKEYWSAKHRFADLFNGVLFGGRQDMLESPEAFQPFLNDYKINLIQVRNPFDVTQFHTEISQFFGMMQVLKDKDTLSTFLAENAEKLVDNDTVWVTAVAANSPRLVNMIKQKEKEEVVDMCTALEELIAEREEQGENRGIERGIEQGEAKATIVMCRKFHLSEEETIEQLKEILNISEAVAWKYLFHYQTK